MINNSTIYIIGETAFHHQGDINYLKKLIKAAADLKLESIKFHLLFDIHDYFVEGHSAIKVIEEWIFPKEKWEEIFQYATEMGLDVIAMCNDVKSLEWINTTCKTPVKAIEIHATGINDVFLLEEAVKFNNTVILGIGGSSFEDINFAVDYLKTRSQDDLFLMFGFQNYPTNYADINFDKIKLIKSTFNLPVGYADHTDPSDQNNEFISVAPILKGINVLEKHFTLDVTEKRIDSQSAVSIKQMKKIKKLSKILTLANGEGGLKMSEAELKYGDTGPMKKAIVARYNIDADPTLELKDLAYKRTEQSSSLSQRQILTLIGSKVKKAILKDDIIDYNNVTYNFKVAETQQFYNNKT
jgi:N,N'-diacetyllegionaminate synthase